MEDEIPVIGLCRSAFSADVRILTDCNGAIKKLTDGFLRSGIKKIGFIGEVEDSNESRGIPRGSRRKL